MRNYKLSIVQKICFAGILIVLVAIFQKVFAINYLPFAPFVRLSFGGPALIIFSSILLGPWFGMLVGAASDLIGFFIFDPKTITPYPMFQITIIYAVLGFASYFVFKWIYKIKNNKKSLFIEGGLFLAIVIAVTLVVCFVPSVTLYGKEYPITTTVKIVLPIISFILLAVLLVAIIFINKSFVKKGKDISVYSISLASFIVEISAMLIFGSLMKTWGFQSLGVTPFVYIFISQLVVGLFNVPFNTIAISYIMLLTDKIIKQN